MSIFLDRFRISLALIFVLVLTHASSAAGEAEELISGLQGWLDGTVDLEGAFEQELLSGAMGVGIEESGQFFVHRPGKLRFDYLLPERKVALVNGASTLLWIAEDENTVRGTLDTQNNLLFTLLVGEHPLVDLFEAGLDLEPTRRGRARLRLVPRTAADELTELILTVRRNGFALEAVEVLDAAGNRMLYRFTEVRRNGGGSDGRFEFEPPDGS